MKLDYITRQIYNRSPYLMKAFLVNIYGWDRYRWRYNKNTEKLVEEAKERETWSEKEWENFRNQKLESLLTRAVNYVPYYKHYWSNRRKKGDFASPMHLENWPILSKEIVRQNPLAFLAEDCNPKKMYHEHTSGTSGKPVHVYWSRETTVSYYALVERRIRHWHRINRKDRYAILGGQLIVPASRHKPPYWINNAGMNHLYLSSYHLSEQTIQDYAAAVNSYKPIYLFGYASSLYSLAFLCDLQNIELFPLKAVISNAEPLYSYQASLLHKVFKTEIVNTYGMSELVAAGCSRSSIDTLHLWPEVGILETFDFKKDQKVDGLGRFIGTSLINPDFCLIRYEVGDAGIIKRSSEGLKFPVIQEIEGRIDDLIVLKDGRRIGRLDPVFKEDFKIREAQIIQEQLNVFKVKVVPASNYLDTDGERIVSSLKDRLGDVIVKVEKVGFIQKGAFGKFKAVVSKLKKDQSA